MHGKLDGEEDASCADYIEALLRGQNPDPAPFIKRVKNSTWAQTIGKSKHPDFSAADMGFALDFNKIDAAIRVTRQSGLLIGQVVLD